MKQSAAVALFLGSYAGRFIGTGILVLGLSFGAQAVGCWLQCKREERC